MVKSGCVLDGKLEFKLAKLSDSKNANKDNIDPSVLFGPSKKPPSDRVSAVFDNLCVSETSYGKLRDDLDAERAKQSMDNPTQAMLDVMAMINKNNDTTGKRRRRRTKSFNIEDKTDNTPAMIEVMRLKKTKMAEDSSDDSEIEFPAFIRRPKVQLPEPITTDIINSTNSRSIKKSPTRKTEVEKLKIEPTQRRRTRGDQSVANREFRSNLRSAFNFGMGVIRTVSQSLPNFLKYD